MKTLTITIVLALAGTAYADQCEWLDAPIAARARQLVEAHPNVIVFCEPCGEKAPGAPVHATRVDLGIPEAGYQDVRIDGNPIDLAYTYVRTSLGTYQNLAMLAGCAVTDVSPSLTIEDETPNGVLITSDADPAPQPDDIAEPIVRIPTNPPPTSLPPPPQIVVLESRPVFPWALIALAGITGFAATLAGVISLAALRRRRAMRPRASELRRND